VPYSLTCGFNQFLSNQLLFFYLLSDFLLSWPFFDILPTKFSYVFLSILCIVVGGLRLSATVFPKKHTLKEYLEDPITNCIL
jgi:hypothetical protein